MNKVFGIGETVYDIIFQNDQPVAAVPGGSVFNGLITLGRLGVDCSLISEVGDDQVGQNIIKFMKENRVRTEFLSCTKGRKSSISLAYLDKNNDAHYSFYKDYQNIHLEFEMPDIHENDVVMFGSFYALNPILRPQVHSFLSYAKKCGAILYYDLNFRDNHKAEAIQLQDTIIENYELADIVRGSHEDFETLYDIFDVDCVYSEKIKSHCKHFIYTCGSNGVELRDGESRYFFSSKDIHPVSTVGAGDNFNAGIVFGLIKGNITHDILSSMDRDEWNKLIEFGIEFGTEACKGLSNYISLEFADLYKIK